jgi:hypothetical protein
VYPTVKASLPEILDSTIIAEYVACPTKFYYSFARKLGSPFASIDLIAGGAFARGLEIFRKSYYGLHSPFKGNVTASLEQGMVEALAAYGEVEVPEFKDAKRPERVITALAAYVEKYPPATDHIQPKLTPDGEPMVEFTFSVPLPIRHPETGNPFLYAGRFDMVGVYKDQLIGVDEKTTSQLGATWAAKWNLRAQFTGYTWALQQHNIPVIGMMTRGVSFLAKSHGFEESLQLRPQWMIDQWYEQMLANVQNMVASWEKNWYNQDFGDTCAAYSSCPFQTLCTSADPEAWIPGRYGIRDWNPLSKVPEVPKEEAKTETVVPSDMPSFLQR